MAQETNIARKVVPVDRRVLVERARAMIPFLRSRAHESEINRHDRTACAACNAAKRHYQ